MIGVDTNILVRLMVQDDEEQGRVAAELIESRCTPADPGYVNLVVLCELVWVLSTAYGYTRDEVSTALRQVLVTDCLEVEEHALAWVALLDYAQGNGDYADCVIGRLNERGGATTTFTFDKRASRNERFTLLGISA